MPFLRVLLLLLVCCMPEITALAQQQDIPIGQWRSHLPNAEARTLTQAGTRIYCGTNGGFFYYDTEDNSLHTLSKVEGFSDVGIQKLAHDPQTNTTVVAYTNTNIDLITANGRIYNLSDILRKQIIGAKFIRHIHIDRGLAYLSTTFGIVVLDLAKREVKNTYSNLGPNGRVLDVFATTTLRDSIYISAVDNGSFRIMRARISNTNLLDYNNWYTFPNRALPGGSKRAIAAFKGKIYVTLDYVGLYYYNGTVWKPTPASIHVPEQFNTLSVTANSLLINNSHNLSELFSPTEIVLNNNSTIQRPVESIRTGNNDLWVADSRTGLLRLSATQTEQFRPNGPFAINAFDLWSVNNQVLVAAGAYDKSSSYTPTFSQAGFYIFKEGEWQNFNPILFPDAQQFPEVKDLVEIIQDPASGTIYLGSHGYGLIKWNGPGNYQVFNDLNSPLVNTANPGDKAVRVTGLAFDAAGTLWISQFTARNSGSAPSLFSLKPDGTWTPYSINFSSSGHLEKIALDDANQKWMIVTYNTAGGILVFNDRTQQWKHLTENSAKLPSLLVNSITKDLNGAMWVGTANGVGVYYSPSLIMNPNYVVDPRPLIDGRYLLENQIVNDIAVDGGNRKWIAAESGLWLFNETGTELIAHFNTENSPLPSNRVNKVVVNHTSGEVFAATDAGIVSYRGAATISENSNACAGVFPNPVRPGFTGQVGISGVPTNAVVKITDLTGTLVYEAQANGNTATWNLMDYNGKRVQKGVYLLLSASADGTQKFSCKVAVLD